MKKVKQLTWGALGLLLVLITVWIVSAHFFLDGLGYRRIQSPISRSYNTERQRPMTQTMTKATKVVILAYMRSGSSLVADILQQSPDVFYVFEPLYSVDRLKLASISNIFTVDNNVIHGSKEVKQRHILESIFNCSFTSLDLPTIYQHHMTNSKTTEMLYQCTRAANTTTDIGNCALATSSRCRRKNTILVKVIRSRMKYMERFLRTYPKLKVVHLIRDPRGLLRSQRMVGHLPEGFVSAERTCNEILRDVQVSLRYKVKYPGRVMTLRYEDIALDPIGMARKLYKFIEIKLTANIEVYIRNITMNNTTKSCVRCLQKNSRYTAFHWRNTLKYQQVADIDQGCRRLYKRTGYLEINDNSNFNDDDIQSMTTMPKSLLEQ